MYRLRRVLKVYKNSRVGGIEGSLYSVGFVWPLFCLGLDGLLQLQSKRFFHIDRQRFSCHAITMIALVAVFQRQGDQRIGVEGQGGEGVIASLSQTCCSSSFPCIVLCCSLQINDLRIFFFEIKYKSYNLPSRNGGLGVLAMLKQISDRIWCCNFSFCRHII